MKTLLIGINSKYIHPSMGAYQLYANSKSETLLHEFTIKDKNEDIINFINSSDCEVVGFSVYIWNIEKIKLLLLSLKDSKKIIFLGGPEASFRVNEFLTQSDYNVNYIISSEGEDSFNELIAYLDKKITIGEVSNLFYVNNKEIKFTKKALPDLNKIKHDYSLIKDYQNRVSYIEASRGCFFNCTYCLASTEKPVRFFPLANIKKDLKYLLDNNAKIIKFLDRSFNINQEYMLDIFKFINENDNNVSTFQFEIVGDKLSKEVISYINTMRKGYLRFEIGIQSTNDETISAIRRHQDFNQLRNNVLAIKDNVVIHTDLICGLPYEGFERFKKSFNDVFLLFTEEVQLGFLKELQGTEISKTKEKYGYHFMKESPYEITSNDYITNEEIRQVKFCEEALEKFYNSHNYKKTIDYLFKKLKLNPFDTFLEIGKYINNIGNIHFLQNDEVAKAFYESLAFLVDDKEKLLFIIKQDYLERFKIKPKIWWDYHISREERKYIYGQLICMYKELNSEILYKYSRLEKCRDEYYLISYLSNQNKTYTLNSHIAMCGFDCSLCPVYKTGDLRCDGCLNSTLEMAINCDIRNCNINKSINSCSKCCNYPCHKMEKLSYNSIIMLDKLNNIYKSKKEGKE